MSSTANDSIHQRARARRLRIRPADRSKEVEKAKARREALKPESERDRERRIDEAMADVALAWDQRMEALVTVDSAEFTAAAALSRLTDEGISMGRAAVLTGLDRSTVRRLRALHLEATKSAPDAETGAGELP